MSNYLTEFPDFKDESLPAIPEGFVDQSWKNETCPHWEKDGIGIWINYSEPSRREISTMSRFIITDDNFQVILETEDWTQVLQALAQIDQDLFREETK
jgi:hypothetical protein